MIILVMLLVYDVLLSKVPILRWYTLSWLLALKGNLWRYDMLNFLYMNGFIHLWWRCLLLMHKPYMSVWFYTYHEWPTWMMNVFMSIAMNIRYADLHGLRSLNAIYVNCAWVGIWCTCCDPFWREVSMMIEDNYAHTYTCIHMNMMCLWFQLKG